MLELNDLRYLVPYACHGQAWKIVLGLVSGPLGLIAISILYHVVSNDIFHSLHHLRGESKS